MCFLPTNDRIIILDPMGEYSPLVRQFGKDGLVVEIAPNSPAFHQSYGFGFEHG